MNYKDFLFKILSESAAGKQNQQFNYRVRHNLCLAKTK